MHSFSLRGIATKAFYGPNAFALGTGTDGHGNPLPYGSGNSSGPPTPSGPGTLNLTVNSDFIGGTTFLTDLMTPQQFTDWTNGLYNVVNVSGIGPFPARGYWVIAGDNTGPTGNGRQAFEIDTVPNIPVTINIDFAHIALYGGGGNGASATGPFTVITTGFLGGDAILIDPFATTVDLNLSNSLAPAGGFLFAGGGGGGGGGAEAVPPTLDHGAGGGGGSAGWIPGAGGTSTGATVVNAPGTAGAIFDPDNGGTGNPATVGGAGGNAGLGVVGGIGGAIHLPGAAGSSTAGGAAGFAVRRSGTPGVTSLLSGNNHVLGLVQ